MPGKLSTGYLHFDNDEPLRVMTQERLFSSKL
jgi:hypothetical protein